MFGPKSNVEKLQAKVTELGSATKSNAAYLALQPDADKILPPLIKFRAPSFSPVLPGAVEAQIAKSIQGLAVKHRSAPRLSGD
jgi:hypothetical protein